MTVIGIHTLDIIELVCAIKVDRTRVRISLRPESCSLGFGCVYVDTSEKLPAIFCTGVD